MSDVTRSRFSKGYLERDCTMCFFYLSNRRGWLRGVAQMKNNTLNDLQSGQEPCWLSPNEREKPPNVLHMASLATMWFRRHLWSHLRAYPLNHILIEIDFNGDHGILEIKTPDKAKLRMTIRIVCNEREKSPNVYPMASWATMWFRIYFWYHVETVS